MADYLEFPRLVHKGTEKRRVNTKKEFDEALGAGFKAHADPPKGSPAEKGEKPLTPAPVDIPTPVNVNSAPDNIPGDAEQSTAVPVEVEKTAKEKAADKAEADADAKRAAKADVKAGR